MDLRLPDPPLGWPGGALRPWRTADAAQLANAWCDREIARWNPVPTDPSVIRAQNWIAGCDDRLSAGRSLDLCIVDTDSDSDIDRSTVIGEIGLSGFDPNRRAALIGYWLLPEGRGRGHASAATDALAAWALSNLELNVLVARCASANLGSHHVALRAGFTHAGSDGSGHELYARRSA